MTDAHAQDGTIKLEDWPALLEHWDRAADEANQGRTEAYQTFRTLASYLAQGMTTDEARDAYQRDHA